MDCGSGEPDAVCDFFGVSEIVLEMGSKGIDHDWIDTDDIGFIVVYDAESIKIKATDSSPFVIDNYCFAVEERFLVFENSDFGAKHFFIMRTSGRTDKWFWFLTGQQKSNIYTAAGGESDDPGQSSVWDKVGGSDEYVMFGIADSIDDAVVQESLAEVWRVGNEVESASVSFGFSESST